MLIGAMTIPRITTSTNHAKNLSPQKASLSCGGVSTDVPHFWQYCVLSGSSFPQFLQDGIFLSSVLNVGRPSIYLSPPPKAGLCLSMTRFGRQRVERVRESAVF
jgi:hypothetical protein